MSKEPSSLSDAVAAPLASRLTSLDALRGFDMFWIIGADGIMRSLDKLGKEGWTGALARQFEHMKWEGFVFYDLIFPLFVFISGISIVFSLDKLMAERGRFAAHLRIFRRFTLLFLLGVFYDLADGPFTEENVLCGVLQRIALCYLFGSLLYCNLKLRGLIATFAVLLVGYWALLSFVPVPDTGEVSFERNNNWAHYIDRHVPPYKKPDPEDYLTTLPAVGSCLLGIFAGMLLKNGATPATKKCLYLAAAGVAMVALGYLWGHQFPIIKRLWTSTYVLVAGGYSCLLLSGFYFVIDVCGLSRWAVPFLWIGTNPLTIYLADNIVNPRKLADRLVGGEVAKACGPYAELLGTALALTFCILLVRFLYQKRIFLKV